jgi:hypothetical protein
MVLTHTSEENIPKIRLCPCGKTNRSALQRIRRTWYMRTFLFWITFKRYKCEKCNQNKWLFD